MLSHAPPKIMAAKEDVPAEVAFGGSMLFLASAGLDGGDEEFDFAKSTG